MRPTALTIFALLLGGCFGGPPAAEPTTGAPGRPAPVTTGPVPSGRPADTIAQFDRDPCSVATGEELRAALGTPFKNLSGTTLRQDGKPKAVDAGCDFAFIAEGTDTSEAFHFIRIQLRKAGDGGQQLATCRAAAKQPPHGPVEVGGDEACLRTNSMLVIRTGTQHFTITVAALPPRADRSDEDTQLAPLATTAAATITPRLPQS